jgi:glycosyltransferase involved in cell wall biosynthesis
MNRMDRYAVADARFGRQAARLRLPAHDAVFAYSYAALEILEQAKRHGKFAVLGQIDPGLIERRIVLEEEARWPGYVEQPCIPSAAYENRNRREWELADRIVVNSEWSRCCLVEAGAAEEKIRICPLAYEAVPDWMKRQDELKQPERLRVLWLGAVSIRKGFPYLVEAAKRLDQRRVEVVVTGPLEISQQAATRATDLVTFLGPVSRSDAPAVYQSADVFVLPTLSDGFAITQLEAMVYGLPVIATERCGDVVVDGVNGLRIAAGDVDALVNAIERLASDAELRRSMSNEARQTAQRFSLDAYGAALMAAMS